MAHCNEHLQLGLIGQKENTVCHISAPDATRINEELLRRWRIEMWGVVYSVLFLILGGILQG